MAADQVLDKARTIAAHQLEAAEDDLEFAGGEFRGAGLARPGDAAPGRRLRGVHRPRPARRHGAEPHGPGHLRPAQLRVPVRHPRVRSSRSTRRPAAVACCDYVAVDDCGNQINPMIVEGQLHGGIVQGVAQALWEEAVYDDDGNLRNPRWPTTCVPGGGRGAAASSWTTRSRRARPTRSGSRASARPAPSARPRGHQRRRRRPGAARHHRHGHAGHARTGAGRPSRPARTETS